MSPVFYTRLQRRLHWLVIVLLGVQYLLQWPMRNAMAVIERQEALDFSGFLVTTLHTWGGVSIALVMLWRWQLRKRKVPLNGGRLTHQYALMVKAHHVSLYAVSIAMAATGSMTYYFGWGYAARLHGAGKWLLITLVAIHIAGALSHLGRNSTVLQRMMGRTSLR